VAGAHADGALGRGRDVGGAAGRQVVAGGEELEDRAGAVEDARALGRGDARLGADAQLGSLGAEFLAGGVGAQHAVAAPRRAADHLDAPALGVAEVVGERAGGGQVGGVGVDPRPGAEVQRPVRRRPVVEGGDHGGGGGGRGRRGGRGVGGGGGGAG